MGHKVTVFEEREKLGGMLRYGIPSYRLPRQLLDAEIESILSLGIEVTHRHHRGRGRVAWRSCRRNTTCLYIAIGAHTGQEGGHPRARTAKM